MIHVPGISYGLWYCCKIWFVNYEMTPLYILCNSIYRFVCDVVRFKAYKFNNKYNLSNWWNRQSHNRWIYLNSFANSDSLTRNAFHLALLCLLNFTRYPRQGRSSRQKCLTWIIRLLAVGKNHLRIEKAF